MIRPDSTAEGDGAGASLDGDADTEAFLERIRRAGPPEEAADLPLIPGVTLLETVGRGGMGVVYRGRDDATGCDVAVKVLRGLEGMASSALDRARREGEILARLDHPNIVRVLWCCVCTPPHPGAEPVPAIVMEWVGGGTLERCSGRERLGAAEAAGVVRDLARAVAEVHALGIVHRDIKPANVLLAPRPTPEGLPVAKLADFGLARGDGFQTRLTRDGAVLGTPGYLAPEQAGIDPAVGEVGPPTDIHGLGALLYWLLAGKAPYEGRTTAATLQLAARGDATPLSALAPRLPRDLVTIVETCLAHHPGRRYRSAGALADDLERFLANRPVLARRAGPGERLAHWARCHPTRAAIVGSVTIAAVGMAAMAIHHVRGLERANLVIRASRDEAVEAEELARRSFASLTDDSAGRLIARGGALDDADRDHLRRIRDQYLAWPLVPDTASGLRFRAAGLQRLATIFLRLNWPEDALESARAAIGSHVDLESRGFADATDDKRRLDLELFECGLLISSGRLDEAAAVSAATIGMIERRLDSNAEMARQLPGALSGLAIVEHQRGRSEESKRLFARAIELCQRNLDASPDDVAVLEGALPVLFNAASTPSFASTPDERAELYRRVVELAERGLTTFETGREFLGSSCLMGLAALSDIDLERGRPADALETVRRQAMLARRLAAELPDSEATTGAVMMVANQAYRCHAALGRPEDAEADLGESVTLAAAAVAAEPAIVSRSRVLAWLLESQADMYLATDRPAEAMASLRRGLEVLEPWTRGPDADAQMLVRAASMRESLDRLVADPAPAAERDATVPLPVE